MYLSVRVFHFHSKARSQEQAKERVVIRGVKREVSMEKKLEAHKQEQLEQTSKM